MPAGALCRRPSPHLRTRHKATFSRYATAELRDGPVTFQLAERAEEVRKRAAASSAAPSTCRSAHADHHLCGTKRSIQTERAQQEACALTRSRTITRASQGTKERGARQTTRTFGMRTTCRRRLRIEGVDVHFSPVYACARGRLRVGSGVDACVDA